MQEPAQSRERPKPQHARRPGRSAHSRGDFLEGMPLEVAEHELSDEAKAAIVIFLSLLDEKQRRLYAGVEAIKYGLGGDKWVAGLLGMHPQTVARGRRELLTGDVEVERARKAGGGRKPVEKKRQR